MELSEIRKEIDSVDNEMRELFIRRMGLSKKVAALKAKTGDSIYKPDREKEMIGRLSAGLDPELTQAYQSFLRQVLRLSREYQEKLIGSGCANRD